jgi:hypothetical protein
MITAAPPLPDPDRSFGPAARVPELWDARAAGRVIDMPSARFR